MIDIILFTVWVLYSAVEGVREAFLWNKSMHSTIESNDIMGVDIHKVFSIQRGLVMLFVIYISISNHQGMGYYRLMGESVILFFVLSLSFPFIHDGVLYLVRNKLDPNVYKEGFKDNPDSEKSTSFWDFTYLERSVYFGLSVFILILNQLLC